MTRRAVMADVASAAGVSQQTVSRVLNNHAKVSTETRARVRAAMRDLDYRPNATARALATGRTHALGVITFDASRYGPASTLDAIAQAAAEVGYSLSSVALRSADPASVEDAIDRLVRQAVDGIITIAPQQEVTRSLARIPHRVPTIALDRSLEESVPAVCVDEQGGARIATEYLLGLGHTTVWHLAGPPEWIAAQERVDGWREAVRAAGRTVPQPVFGDWSAESGYARGRLLARRPEVTAVFVANDQMAVGLLLALHEAGRRVPEDVSVVGFDDIPEAAYQIPPLTTVRVDFAEVGRQTLALMLDQLEHGPRSWARTTTPVELVIRRSAGPAR